MPYIPTIRNYKPFYIETGSDSAAWDTTTYGMIVQSQPFPEVTEVKEPYKNTWFDENGDDEYMDSLYLKAFEYTIKFYVQTFTNTNKTAIEQLNSQKNDFKAKLLDGGFKIWDSWQQRGFQDVRLAKMSIESRKVTDEYAWAIFSVTLKVNDPATEVTYSNNHITAVV